MFYLKIFLYLLIISTFLFAGELEVEGDLKVTGNIDAQNQRIKNVGIPQELTDAINGNVLQDAFRDDGNYEYKMYYVVFPVFCDWVSYDYISVYKSIDFQESGSDWLTKINLLGDEGWSLIFQTDMDRQVSGAVTANTNAECYMGQLYLMTLRRTIDE